MSNHEDFSYEKYTWYDTFYKHLICLLRSFNSVGKMWHMVGDTVLFYYVKICVCIEKKDQQMSKVKVVLSNWQGFKWFFSSFFILFSSFQNGSHHSKNMNIKLFFNKRRKFLLIILVTVVSLHSSKMDQDIQLQSAIHSIMFIKHLLHTKPWECEGRADPGRPSSSLRSRGKYSALVC